MSFTTRKLPTDAQPLFTHDEIASVDKLSLGEIRSELDEVKKHIEEIAAKLRNKTRDAGAAFYGKGQYENKGLGYYTHRQWLLEQAHIKKTGDTYTRPRWLLGP